MAKNNEGPVNASSVTINADIAGGHPFLLCTTCGYRQSITDGQLYVARWCCPQCHAEHVDPDAEHNMRWR